MAFHSSHRNVAGAVVQIFVHGTVYSKTLGEWRERFDKIANSNYVAGGQIGNLVDETVASVWNLADPTTRKDTVSNIVTAIETAVLPYFARFEDMDALVTTLVTQDIPSMTIDRVIEFLICFTDVETARAAAVNFLQRRPDLLRSYIRDYGRYAERGLNWSHASGYAKQLAFASHLFELGDLTQDGA